MGMMTSQYRKVAPASIQRRAVVRHAVLLQRITAHSDKNPPCEAQLEDVSAYGCRLIVGAIYSEGEKLRLQFSSGDPVCVTVIWSDDGRVGCKFDEILNQVLYRELTLHSS